MKRRRTGWGRQKKDYYCILIGLFGITAEELAEEGLSYEMLRALDGVLL